MLLRAVTPEELIPLFGMLTGVLVVGLIALTIVRVAQSQIGQAIARRIHGRAGEDPELVGELAALRDQVTDLAHRVAETEERLDFTERLLTRGHEEAKPHE